MQKKSLFFFAFPNESTFLEDYIFTKQLNYCKKGKNIVPLHGGKEITPKIKT